MRTKAYHAFEQKLNYFNDDIELIDILRNSVLKGDLSDNTSTHVLKRVDSTKHSHIARRKNSDGGRELVMNHLRSTVYSSFIKDVYEEVTQYLRTIIEKSCMNGFNSGRIIGEHSFKADAKTILGLGNWDNVCRMVSDSVFQSLEAERSTLSLLQKVTAKLGLNVADTHIKAALPYLEIRHFLVHTDGKVSTEYIKNYPNIKTDKKGHIVLDYQFILNMRTSVKSLIAEYDKEVINKALLKTEDTQP
jgi:hypothetical protein